MDKQAAKVILKTPTEWHSPERFEAQPKQASSALATFTVVATYTTVH